MFQYFVANDYTRLGFSQHKDEKSVFGVFQVILTAFKGVNKKSETYLSIYHFKNDNHRNETQ